MKNCIIVTDDSMMLHMYLFSSKELCYVTCGHYDNIIYDIIHWITVMSYDKEDYYIPITDTTLELSIFWPSDTESRINELRFSESIPLSFKTRLTSVTCFCGDLT